jgi:hypothetical protein
MLRDCVAESPIRISDQYSVAVGFESPILQLPLQMDLAYLLPGSLGHMQQRRLGA